MKKLSKMMVGAIAFCMGVFGVYTVSAKTVIWGGATSGTWKVGEGGWIDEGGNACVFEDGDNVILSNATGKVTLNMQGSFFKVGDFLFNSDKTYVLQPNSSGEANNSCTNMLSFTKLGTGELQFDGFGGSYTNDIRILQGTVSNTGTKDSGAKDGSWTAWGNVTVPRRITVGSGDTNNIASAKFAVNSGCLNSFGPIWTKPAATVVLDAGFLEYAREQSFGDMELLHGGVISTGEKSANNAAYFAFNGKVSVLRSPIAENEEVIVPAICFRNHYSSQVRGIRLGLAGEPAEFYVEELTSADGTDDGITDFNLASAIADYDDGERVIRSSWRKTGPGTLTFPSGGKTIKVSSLSVTGNSYYTGDIFIDEGCVRVQLSAAGSGGKGGAMGNLWTNRTIYVNSGAKLELASSQVFGAATMPSLLATIVVSNGTYEIIHASKYQLQNTANVRVIGSGRLIYNDITGNSTEYSKTYFGGEMYFETDEPVTLPVASGVYLDYRTDLQEEVVDEKTINKFGFTEFCVMPTKVNPTNAADLVVYSTLRKHTDTTRFTGLKKTGSGVMALMAKNKYDYDTVVCDGGLYIDGAAEISSDAIVKNGGTIGGAGKIKGNLTIEENGGLLISATNMTSSLTVTGDVTLPTKGLLMIYDYDGTLDNLPSVAKGISLPNLASTSSLDTNGWRVRVKGFTDRETRNLTVIKEGDTLSIKKTSPGFCVIVK